MLKIVASAMCATLVCACVEDRAPASASIPSAFQGRWVGEVGEAFDFPDTVKEREVNVTGSSCGWGYVGETRPLFLASSCQLNTKGELVIKHVHSTSTIILHREGDELVGRFFYGLHGNKPLRLRRV